MLTDESTWVLMLYQQQVPPAVVYRITVLGSQGNPLGVSIGLMGCDECGASHAPISRGVKMPLFCAFHDYSQPAYGSRQQHQCEGSDGVLLHAVTSPGRQACMQVCDNSMP